MKREKRKKEGQSRKGASHTNTHTDVHAHNCSGVMYLYQRGIVKEVGLDKLRVKEVFQGFVC